MKKLTFDSALDQFSQKETARTLVQRKVIVAPPSNEHYAQPITTLDYTKRASSADALDINSGTGISNYY